MLAVQSGFILFIKDYQFSLQINTLEREREKGERTCAFFVPKSVLYLSSPNIELETLPRAKTFGSEGRQVSVDKKLSTSTRADLCLLTFFSQVFSSHNLKHYLRELCLSGIGK